MTEQVAAMRSDGLWARTTDESEVSDAQPFPKREDAMTEEKN